ncbi:MAG: sporulation protein YqfD [Oscillospiraceae bacterium]|nr:sporulation protein YqfD [Oscillospiraceae bacterium]
MINYLYRKLAGTVDFIAEGADTERLLTYCTGSGIEIINPHKSGGYKLLGTVFAKDYKKMKRPARKIGLKLRMRKKHGLYFFARKHRAKIGMLAGMVFIAFAVFSMNRFIWEINVEGNKNIPAEEIIASAEKMGLVAGTFSKSHSVQDIEWSIMRDFAGLASVEINIQGSYANISVRETAGEPEMKSDDDVPVNIIASRYGVIRKIDVFDGQETVAIGDAVMKGDLLVSAVYEDSHNKLTLKHARANIIAETDYTIEVEFPLEQTIRKNGEIKKTVTKIEVFGHEFNFGSSKNIDNLPSETSEKHLYFFWIELPINVTTTHYFSVKENTVTYNFEQGRDGAFLLLEEAEESEMSEMEIISRTLTEKVKNNKYIIKADYICLMNIGEEQPIESDIPWENTDDMS